MFDLCSNSESAKTIKALREVVDSLSAHLRTGGLRSQHAASDVQALQKQISILESKVNGLHDDPAAPSKLHIKVKGMLSAHRVVTTRRAHCRKAAPWYPRRWR